MQNPVNGGVPLSPLDMLVIIYCCHLSLVMTRNLRYKTISFSCPSLPRFSNSSPTPVVMNLRKPWRQWRTGELGGAVAHRVAESLWFSDWMAAINVTEHVQWNMSERKLHHLHALTIEFFLTLGSPALFFWHLEA